MVQLQYATLSQIADELKRRAVINKSSRHPMVASDINLLLLEMAAKLRRFDKILEAGFLDGSQGQGDRIMVSEAEFSILYDSLLLARSLHKNDAILRRTLTRASSTLSLFYHTITISRQATIDVLALIVTSSSACKCSPPGGGESFCSGACFARAYLDKLKEL